VQRFVPCAGKPGCPTRVELSGTRCYGRVMADTSPPTSSMLS
jgi:hypothetical protein